MLNNNVHRSACVVINKSYLSLFKANITFQDTELILPLINLSEDNVRLYKKQYDGFFTMKDYMVTKVVNDFYGNSKSGIVTKFSSDIVSLMEESNYWSKSFNTGLNITNKFIDRGFNLSINQRIKDKKLKTIIDEVNEIPKEGDNYFGFLYRKKQYVDISSIIKKNGYTLYRINNNQNTMTKEDLCFILGNIKSNYEYYKLFCNLLISKDYCHLLLNNETFMKRFIDGEYYDERYEKVNIFYRYILAFKYAIGYSWLTFYIEESIKKTRICDEDRFVFSINTANKLPNFPIIYDENIHQNPYLPILISRDIIDVKKNCIGVENYKGNYGIVDFDTFQDNLNIFLCGTKSINILKGVDWENIGLTGSVIPACITRFNPLETLFSDKDRFFNEYYCTSDVDVMCNIQDPFKYIDKANSFYEKIKSNFLALSEKFTDKKIQFTSIKSAAIIVNENFIRKNIVKNGSKFTYEYIFTHLDDIEVISIFYEYYIKWKISENKKYISKNEWKDKKYNCFFDIATLETVVVIFARTQNDWDKYWKDVKNKKVTNCTYSAEEELEELEKEYYNDNDIDSDEIENELDSENILFNCHENLKFKISSKYINHDFEFFKTKYEGSFFLNCVTISFTLCKRIL